MKGLSDAGAFPSMEDEEESRFHFRRNIHLSSSTVSFSSASMMTAMLSRDGTQIFWSLLCAEEVSILAARVQATADASILVKELLRLTVVKSHFLL